ncbi:MAG: hypothetical protein GY927_00875 [bacterium]|nr:hypothetical protein [bacterium]
MDEQDEEEKAIEREYRRKVFFIVAAGGLGLLLIMGKLLSVYLHLI